MIIVDYCETKYIFRTRRIISSSMCIIVYPESNKLNHRLKWTSRFHHFFFFLSKSFVKKTLDRIHDLDIVSCHRFKS